MNSTLHAFASRPAQGMVAEMLACLRSIARGYPPCFTSWGGDVVLKKVRDEFLPNFIKHEHLVEEEGGYEGKEFYGKEALKMKLEDCRLAAAGSELLNLELVKPLAVFDWLLSQEEKVEVQALLKRIGREHGLQGASTLVATSSAPSSSSSSISKAKKRPLEVVDNVANLFV